jgi:hypothetical protein
MRRNTNFDLNWRASPRPYLGEPGGESPSGHSTRTDDPRMSAAAPPVGEVAVASASGQQETWPPSIWSHKKVGSALAAQVGRAENPRSERAARVPSAGSIPKR